MDIDCNLKEIKTSCYIPNREKMKLSLIDIKSEIQINNETLNEFTDS